ncbi:nitroreductase family protein [Algivirga pacifica]|uniref:Oxygen-insensitive NAD(P)H-dependent nitroreductase NfsB n=1 Tax=Algivirga pacifica TaxID=1162670 RepID=A0ABP9DKF2_9BACT
MNFTDLMQARYTTKKYDANKKIDIEKIEQLKDILHMSPSSINSQPWRFTFVESEEVKTKLAKASYFNEEKVLNASHLVVFSAINNKVLFEEQINANLPEGAVGYYNNFLKEKPEEELHDWHVKQVYLALGVFLTACAGMEIDATPMEGIVAEEYDEILGLTGYKTTFAVAIGYRDEEDQNQPHINPKSRLNREEVIFTV